MIRTRQFSLAVAAMLLAFAASANSQAPVTIKAVLSGEVAILDPISTTNYRTRDFSYLVWDTLVSVDSEGNYHPQMLESYSASEDKLHYTFTLRPGLRWSDGTPVTAIDCVASIKRWGARDGMGKQMMSRTQRLAATSNDTFVLELKEPFGYVIESLGKPYSNVPVMMPERIAKSDPNTAITEIVGSGPFIFKKESWVPGVRMVLEKNPHYVPRAEPADGFAGGKRVHVDRLELITMPDRATAVSALQTGEVDYVQLVPYDFLPILKNNPDIELDSTKKGIGNMMMGARPNHVQPPFDNVKVRQALQALVDQKSILDAIGTPEGLGTDCSSIFMCNAPYSSNAGQETLVNPSIEKAKKLLKESGYKNERVVILDSADIPTIHMPAVVIGELMKKAGFNVEVQSADWATISQRRWNKKPVEEGGWSLFAVQWEGYDLSTPLTHYGIAHNCTGGYAGWSCDQEISKLFERFIASNDPAERQTLADQMQARAFESVPIVLGGQFAPVHAYRSELKGVITGMGIPLFWNIKK